MPPDLSRVCQLMAQPSGTDLLYLLRDIYYGRSSVARDNSGELLEMAAHGGLVDNHRQAALRLTALGYLVGYVAKEYCNWLDRGRIMPESAIPPPAMFEGKDVLDIGCSFGRFLWEFQRSARSVTGIDLQPEFAVLGAALAKREGIVPPRIVTGSATALADHFNDESFDFVFSRLMMTHVPLRHALPQLMRVLRTGGSFWIQIESFREGLDKFGRALQSRNVRASAFGALGVANAVLFSTIRLQLSVRSSGRMHSKHQPVYPTAAAWRRALQSHGARECRAEFRSPFSLVVTGTK
jgi:SAM-dependent methyltransferase